MKQIELLAPAKDLACGLAAIDSGADAVYIGAPRFGARAQAGNTLDDIAALVAHAHRYWARVYAAVNTLLYDHELPDAVQLIHRLHEIDVDAVIVQDAGLLECDLPPIPLIASTQMHNDRPEKIAFLEQVGFQRTILARELSLEQIRAIRTQTHIELEAFVHGALCVCYSGQCYLSYALGGRSGNRGECAQPCRRRYTLVDRNGTEIIKDKHLISLCDMDRSAYLGDLIDAGVCAFKIEGRLKDRAYVINVVSNYRQALDTILKEKGLRKASSGRSRVDFVPDVSKTFNRGYTDYFMRGKGAKIGAIDTPKMVGEVVGQVRRVTERWIEIDGVVDLHNGDGLCFFAAAGELTGTVVTGVESRRVWVDNTEGLRMGSMVYRNHDHQFLSAVNKSRVERKIAVRFTLSETADGLALTVVDEDGNSVFAKLEIEKQRARKPEQMVEAARKQLAKTGDTEFECVGIEMDWAEAVFAPLSALNALRRDALDALAQARAQNRPRLDILPLKNDAPYPAPRLTYLGNVLNQQAAAFYRRHGVTEIEPAAESGL
ncbi:MAG: U32 family peptidase, partial [Anaerolineae bacterium]|nr:U32 family peptidase [Anaerolineae bacterium]